MTNSGEEIKAVSLPVMNNKPLMTFQFNPLCDCCHVPYFGERVHCDYCAKKYHGVKL